MNKVIAVVAIRTSRDTCSKNIEEAYHGVPLRALLSANGYFPEDWPSFRPVDDRPIELMSHARPLVAVSLDQIRVCLTSRVGRVLCDCSESPFDGDRSPW